MLKLGPLLTLLLVITGCSHTQVHLYGRYLSSAQTEQLRSSLQKQGFAVTVNDLAFPAQVQQNTLITGLLMDRPDEADQLRTILRQQGWPLQRVESMVHGNHWYSGNAVGLFLLPPGVTIQQTQHPKDLSYLYQGVSCANPVSLELQANQRFLIHTGAKNNFNAAMLQGAVDLWWSSFVRFGHRVVAAFWARNEARGIVILCEQRVTKPKTSPNEPVGQRLAALSAALVLVCVE